METINLQQSNPEELKEADVQMKIKRIIDALTSLTRSECEFLQLKRFFDRDQRYHAEDTEWIQLPSADDGVSITAENSLHTGKAFAVQYYPQTDEEKPASYYYRQSPRTNQDYMGKIEEEKIHIHELPSTGISHNDLPREESQHVLKILNAGADEADAYLRILQTRKNITKAIQS